MSSLWRSTRETMWDVGQSKMGFVMFLTHPAFTVRHECVGLKFQKKREIFLPATG